jgi:hypothetical protein
MGYCMNTRESNFRIKKENFDKALLAIKTLDPSQGSGYTAGRSHFSWVEESEYKAAESLFQALASWRWLAGISDSGNIDSIEFYGEKLGDDELLFQAIAPFVEAGSFIEMQGEEGKIWRWVFNGRTVEERQAKLTFD